MNLSAIECVSLVRFLRDLNFSHIGNGVYEYKKLSIIIYTSSNLENLYVKYDNKEIYFNSLSHITNTLITLTRESKIDNILKK